MEGREEKKKRRDLGREEGVRRVQREEDQRPAEAARTGGIVAASLKGRDSKISRVSDPTPFPDLPTHLGPAGYPTRVAIVSGGKYQVRAPRSERRAKSESTKDRNELTFLLSGAQPTAGKDNEELQSSRKRMRERTHLGGQVKSTQTPPSTSVIPPAFAHAA